MLEDISVNKNKQKPVGKMSRLVPHLLFNRNVMRAHTSFITRKKPNHFRQMANVFFLFLQAVYTLYLTIY